MKRCDCDLCKRQRKFQKVMRSYKFKEEDRKFIEKIYEDLNMTEFDNDVNEAVLDGSWPSAKEILTRALDKAAEIEWRRSKGERI